MQVQTSADVLWSPEMGRLGVAMDYWPYFVLVVIALAAIMVRIRHVTIFEYERGLKYVDGRFRKLLAPGRHWFLGFFTTIHRIDVRKRYVSIPGQEVLSADGVTLKASIAAEYSIADPDVAVNKVQSYETALYVLLQSALREIIGTVEIEAALSARGDMAKRLHELSLAKAKELGLDLISVSLKDVMLPGKMKEIFGQVVKARLEGQAALEKTRAETAALRNLANAAKMIDGNPNLLQLRLLQAVSDTSGNTLVLGFPAGSSPMPIRTSSASSATGNANQSEPNAADS